MTCPKCGKQLLDGGKFCPHCGAPIAQATVDPLLGKTLGNYRVLKALASGAMGQVYVGEQLNLGRQVCIKTLKPELLGDPTVIARFEREAKAVSALKHPNIAQVIDFGRSGAQLYLVMELIEGGSLRALIERDAPLPLERACQLMMQVLSALEEAHHLGIVHRDLKPENVLLGRLRDGSEVAKVVDFGIAKVIEDRGREQNLTGTGLVCGTPGYMAPEQIAGEPLDGRADVYAAGVVLFELLTGKPVFKSSSLADLLRQHLTADPPAPSQVTSLPISAEVDQLVLSALARERELRLGSALDFKRALEQVRPSARLTSQKLPALQAITCGKCKAPNPPGQKFCGQCGAPIAPAASSSGSFEALKKVMSTDLVEHLGRLPETLTAEKRNVTIIFGDISGFTQMSEKMAPEAVREIMNRCFDGMVEAVSRYDGTVDKFIGDAIMVLFGAPKAHEDDAERAVRCALDMHAYLAEVNKTVSMPLQMRIGINAGEVVAGGVGGQRRMDYTVMGDVVNTAQRIEGSAAPGRILVSAAVKRLTDHAIAYRALPAISVKGKSEPVAVYEVEGLANQRAGLEPLVGRRDELGKLDVLIKQVKGSKPGGVLFLGEGGIGKSRLLDEARERAEAAGMKVVVARARRMIAAGELELVREAIFALVGGLPASMTEADARLRELAAFGVAPNDVLRLEHLFGSAPGLVGFEREESRRLDQVSVVQTFLACARKAGGLCVLLDDAHLGDATSLEYFDELIFRSAGTPLALIATARPGETDKLLKRVPRFELKGLAAADVRTLAKQQLAGADLPDVVAETLVKRADGNPYIAREILRTLIDGGVLQLRGGAWSTAETIHTFSLPDSVGQLLAARIDALSPRARQLLRFGAVHARVFPLELVIAAMETQSADAQAALTECRNRAFLVEVDQPAGCVQIKQELVLSAVLKGISETDARHIHGRLADALEQGLPSGDAHPSEALARHFLGAGKSRKAATYFSASAERLASKSALFAAAEAYRKAIALTREEISKTPGTPDAAWAQVLALACKLAPIEGVIAPAAALELLVEVLEKTPAAVDAKVRAETLRQKGVLELKLSRPADAEASLTEATRLFGGDATPEQRGALEAELASVREARGDYAGATHLLLEALKRIAGAKLLDRDLLWRALNQLGRVHLRIGEVVKAREFFENARAQAQKARSAVGEVKALTNLAGALGTAGEVVEAERMFKAALELAGTVGDRIDIARIEFNLGRLCLTTGRKDEARVRLESALEQANVVAWREGVASATQALDALKAEGAPNETKSIRRA